MKKIRDMSAEELIKVQRLADEQGFLPGDHMPPWLGGPTETSLIDKWGPTDGARVWERCVRQQKAAKARVDKVA